MQNIPSTQSQKLIGFTKYLVLLSSFILFTRCGSLNPSQPNTVPVSHSQWTTLLQKYVEDNGYVNYEGFQKDTAQLRAYLNILSQNAPNDSLWTKSEQLAYWLNTYNAYTVDLILRHYPIGSIKDIGGSLQVPFINTPWDIKFIQINGEAYDLNNIEHNILRKNFNEPRIHFAINCASISCPKLRKEAYTGERVEQQLEEQALIFINDSTKNSIRPNSLEISKLFSWFSEDFEREGSIIPFLNKYAKVKIAEDASISFKSYDWGLNEQKD